MGPEDRTAPGTPADSVGVTYLNASLVTAVSIVMLFAACGPGPGPGDFKADFKSNALFFTNMSKRVKGTSPHGAQADLVLDQRPRGHRAEDLRRA